MLNLQAEMTMFSKTLMLKRPCLVNYMQLTSWVIIISCHSQPRAQA